MGMIYRAHDTSLHRDVALKFLKPGVPPIARERFSREARIGASMSHPNLVPVFDRGRLPDGGEWLAMELLAGHDLHDVIESQGRLGVPLLVDIFTQILDVLGYVHERDLVHRDVKPENVFVVRDPRCNRVTVARLLDFGIALDRRERTPRTAMVVGDPRYMSPEQTRLDTPVDGRADLYAVGVALYEAATGRHPLHERLNGPMLGLLYGHREGGFEPPSHFVPGGLPQRFSRALDAIVACACAVDPEGRYPTADAMREEIAALAELAQTQSPDGLVAANGGEGTDLRSAS